MMNLESFQLFFQGKSRRSLNCEQSSSRINFTECVRKFIKKRDI